MKLLSTQIKNDVLDSMIQILDESRTRIIAANKKDLDNFDPSDRAMYDRLIVDEKKIDAMISSVQKVRDQRDPVGQVKSLINLDNGLKVINKTAPFGTIMIIYESRPDVTIEAAVLAFKANSKILLKGGKEAINSNKELIKCWHIALTSNGLSENYIKLLNLDRSATQEFLKYPSEKLDLIVPRGGEKLIEFVKKNATCPVLVSGRGNNFIYVHKEADWKMAISIILNAKTQKISACNALDKILIDKNIQDFELKIKELEMILKNEKVEVLLEPSIASSKAGSKVVDGKEIWYEEFLAMKVLIGASKDLPSAIRKINKYSGGHSAAIITKNVETATKFMEQVDSAAVYHNASTRFTDGGEMGVGAELAISTDKLHHRGPLGLEQLVTNKYYVYGDVQVRE